MSKAVAARAQCATGAAADGPPGGRETPVSSPADDVGSVPTPGSPTPPGLAKITVAIWHNVAFNGEGFNGSPFSEATRWRCQASIEVSQQHVVVTEVPGEPVVGTGPVVRPAGPLAAV